jgi:hypothetical protein
MWTCTGKVKPAVLAQRFELRASLGEAFETFERALRERGS